MKHEQSYYEAGVALAQLSTFLTLDIRGVLAAVPPLTIGRTRILMQLWQGPLQLTELAENEQIRLPTASTRISRMVKEGLVMRDRGTSDRRVKLITITPMGRDTVRRGIQMIDEFLESRLRLLTTEEVEQAAILIPRLALVFRGENRELMPHASRERRPETLVS